MLTKPQLIAARAHFGIYKDFATRKHDGAVMAGNTIGQLFRVTTFGELHGLALGCIVDGVPPGIPLTEADLQHDLDRRRPGTSRYTTQRREPDQVKILSGVFEGVTTGTSIGLLIENTDQLLSGLRRD